MPKGSYKLGTEAQIRLLLVKRIAQLNRMLKMVTGNAQSLAKAPGRKVGRPRKTA